MAKKPRLPNFGLLLYGPSGAGKTELAKIIAPLPVRVFNFENSNWINDPDAGVEVVNARKWFRTNLPEDASEALLKVKDAFSQAADDMDKGLIASVVIDNISVLADWSYAEAEHTMAGTSDKKATQKQFTVSRQADVLKTVLSAVRGIDRVIALAHSYEDTGSNIANTIVLQRDILLPSKKLRGMIGTYFQTVFYQWTERDDDGNKKFLISSEGSELSVSISRGMPPSFVPFKKKRVDAVSPMLKAVLSGEDPPAPEPKAAKGGA